MHRGAQLSKSYNNHVAKFVDSQSNMTIEHSSAEIPPSYDYVLAQAFSNEQQQPPFMTDETANQQVQLPSVPHDTVMAVHTCTTPPMQQLTVHHSSYDHAAQASSNERQLPPVPPDTATTVHTRTTPLMQEPTVYHYQNPLTGERIASLLPPNHPKMICLQEGCHVNETKFGILGILAAIIWFPLGICLCFLDRRIKCKRCGLVIN
ncbi:hypothetical protein BD769DRAFT_1448236, partial [Suillus cothurnatus]